MKQFINQIDAEEWLSEHTGKATYLDKYNLVRTLQRGPADRKPIDLTCLPENEYGSPDIEYAITGRVDAALSEYAMQQYIKACYETDEFIQMPNGFFSQAGCVGINQCNSYSAKHLSEFDPEDIQYMPKW